MRVQRFDARVDTGPGGRGVIAVPFDPDEARIEEVVGLLAAGIKERPRS